MSNDYKDYTIKLHCNEAFYRALVLMLRYGEKLSSWGSSRVLGIFCDGDGHDKVKVLETSELVTESDKGILTSDRLEVIKPDWTEGDFLLDTDAVYDEV